MAISPDGSQLAYTDSEGLHVRQLRTGQTRALGPCLEACPVGWSSDGLQLLTTARGGLRRVVVSTGASSVVRLPLGWDITGGLDVNNRGRVVMSGCANDEAALMQVDITGDQPVVSLTAGRVAVVRDPRWSPDGRRVAYIRLAPGTGTDSVLTVDAQGRDGRGVPLADGEYALHLDWSARGRLAALVRGPGTRTRWWSCTRTGRP